MQIKLLFKPIVALLNKILTKNQKSDMTKYIETISAKVEGVKVFSDIFPDTNINIVVVLCESDSIPSTLSPYLSPNDNIVTIVITGAYTKGVSSLLDIRQFILDHYKDRINGYVTVIANDIIGKLDQYAKQYKVVAKIQDTIKSKVSNIDLVDIIVTAIKAKMIGVDFNSILPEAVKGKVEILKSLLSTEDVALIYQLMANLYGKQINAFLPSKFADNVGTVQVF